MQKEPILSLVQNMPADESTEYIFELSAKEAIIN